LITLSKTYVRFFSFRPHYGNISAAQTITPTTAQKNNQFLKIERKLCYFQLPQISFIAIKVKTKPSRIAPFALAISKFKNRLRKRKIIIFAFIKK
jgi:hypothetical protein